MLLLVRLFVVCGGFKASLCTVEYKRPCLVPYLKTFHLSYRIFTHIYRSLNIDEEKELITPFGCRAGTIMVL